MSVSTYGPRCPKPEPNVDGVCRNCGRPTAFVGTMLQHKRGRWRDPLGLSKPRGQAITIRPSVQAIPMNVPSCGTCLAYMQDTAYGLRCPWSKNLTGDCDWPYKNPDNRRVA